MSCPDGKVSPSGSTNVGDCTECWATGLFANEDACVTACPPGRYGHESRGSCIDCPAGFYAETQAQTSCSPCAAGKSTGGVAGSSTCSDCAAGRYSDESSRCEDCGLGKYSDNVGSTSCTNCAVGTISASTGQTSCERCQNEHFAVSEGSTSCDQCEEGKRAPREGASFCSTVHEVANQASLWNTITKFGHDRMELGDFVLLSSGTYSHGLSGGSTGESVLLWDIEV